MQEKQWKAITAVLAALVILEFAIILNFIYTSPVPRPSLLRETECSSSICTEVGASRFYYDNYMQMCYCYKGSELLKQQYMK